MRCHDRPAAFVLRKHLASNRLEVALVGVGNRKIALRRLNLPDDAFLEMRLRPDARDLLEIGEDRSVAKGQEHSRAVPRLLQCAPEGAARICVVLVGRRRQDVEVRIWERTFRPGIANVEAGLAR